MAAETTDQAEAAGTTEQAGTAPSGITAIARSRVAALVAVLVLALAGTGAFYATRSYTVTIVTPSATGLVAGTPVMMNGFHAGSIESIEVRDGRAEIVTALESDYAPLHSGATAHVIWKAVLGERLLRIDDAPAGNPEIPSGGQLDGAAPDPVEIDDVLSALDPETRTRLSSTVRRLNDTVAGSEADLNATLGSAGPAVGALGNVLRGLGTDGEAIKQLVTQVNGTVSVLAARDADMERIVDQLGNASASTAARRDRLVETLGELPGTLDRAHEVLGAVPPTVDEAVPLLDDLRPATAALPSVSSKLQPVLADLRPAMADLRPTLDASSELLRHTPGLLDSAKDTVPASTHMVDSLKPALEFLRPYSPELVGWMSNWNSAFANSDGNGHFARIFVQSGGEAANVNPGIMTPGVTRNLEPDPGTSVGTPWTDAFGSGER